MTNLPSGAPARPEDAQRPSEHSEQSLDPDEYPRAHVQLPEHQASYDDPAWDDPDRWVLGPWLPDGAVLVPDRRRATRGRADR